MSDSSRPDGYGQYPQNPDTPYGHGSPYGQGSPYDQQGANGAYDQQGAYGSYHHRGAYGSYGQQGYHPQGYGQDGAGYHQPGDPAAGGPTGPGGPAGPGDQPAGGGGRGLVIGIVVAVVLLLGAAVTALILLLGGGDDEDAQAEEAGGAGDTEADADDGDAGEDGDGGSEASDAQSVVQAYLEALADGDAETALSHLAASPSDTTLLTDEVLSASLEEGAITDIEVDEPVNDSEIYGDVDARFSVGGQSVSYTFYVNSSDQGETWAIDNGTVDVPSPLSVGDAVLTVNGEEVEGDSVPAFIGSTLTFDVESENFTFEDEATVVVEDAYVDVYDLELALTDDATERWREVIQEEIEDCLASNEREAGCGLDLPEQLSGTGIEEGTVERSINSSAQQSIEQMTPRLDYDNPNLVSPASLSVTVSTDVQGTDGNLYEIYGEPTSLGTPVVDMNADELEVTWE